METYKFNAVMPLSTTLWIVVVGLGSAISMYGKRGSVKSEQEVADCRGEDAPCAAGKGDSISRDGVDSGDGAKSHSRESQNGGDSSPLDSTLLSVNENAPTDSSVKLCTRSERNGRWALVNGEPAAKESWTGIVVGISAGDGSFMANDVG